MQPLIVSRQINIQHKRRKLSSVLSPSTQKLLFLKYAQCKYQDINTQNITIVVFFPHMLKICLGQITKLVFLKHVFTSFQIFSLNFYSEPGRSSKVIDNDASESFCLGLSPQSATYQLGELNMLFNPPSLVFQSVNENNNNAFFVMV